MNVLYPLYVLLIRRLAYKIIILEFQSKLNYAQQWQFCKEDDNVSHKSLILYVLLAYYVIVFDILLWLEGRGKHMFIRLHIIA